MVPLLMEGEGLQKGKIWNSSEFKYFCKEIDLEYSWWKVPKILAGVPCPPSFFWARPQRKQSFFGRVSFSQMKSFFLKHSHGWDHLADAESIMNTPYCLNKCWQHQSHEFHTDKTNTERKGCLCRWKNDSSQPRGQKKGESSKLKIEQKICNFTKWMLLTT